MKMSVIYHSENGNTQKMAEIIVSAMNTLDGAEAKSFSIDKIDENWVMDSKCVIVGTPIYMANLTSKLKLWLETDAKNYALSGKIGGAFATAAYVHGGGDLGIRTILDHMMCYGMLTYSAGGSQGVPVIHLGPVSINENCENYTETFEIYGKRMAEKTLEVFSK